MDIQLTPAAWPILSLLTVLPLAAGALVAALKDDETIRNVTLGAGLLECLLAVPLIAGFDPTLSGFQFVEVREWVPAWGLTFSLGVDGMALTLVLLSVLLLPLCALGSWTYVQRRVKAFHLCLLTMTSACVGVFSALDFILFYVFWEIMLVPMYMLIAVWGGPNRRYASLKFVVYTLAGSALLLAVIVAYRVEAGSFFLPDLLARSHFPALQAFAFPALALAFAVKTPMFPLHTWLPAAHVEAPAAGSVYLASVMLKMGTYGFIRLCMGLAPQASVDWAPVMLAFSVAAILYGGFTALGQSDLKRLIAYSSVGHMGFVTLGIFVFNRPGMEGAILQMINHGVTTGALFLMMGMSYERGHSRALDDHLAIGKLAPGFMLMFGLFSLASLAFPGTNGFVSEALAMIGAFVKSPWLGVMLAPGAVLTAAYMLRVMKRLGFGTVGGKPPPGHWFDLRPREWLALAPLAFLVFYLGLAPGWTLDAVRTSVDDSLARLALVEAAGPRKAEISTSALSALTALIEGKAK